MRAKNYRIDINQSQKGEVSICRLLIVLFCTLPGSWACGGEDIESAAFPAVYDKVDDRLDYFQLDLAQQSLLRSTAKMVSKTSFSGNYSRLLTQPLWQNVEQHLGNPLCEGERFREQPTASGCSGFFIGKDLVITAGHCMTGKKNCGENVFLFDYFYQKSEAEDITKIRPEQIYHCKQIVFRGFDSKEEVDYAIVRVDRQVVGRTPLVIDQLADIKLSDTLAALGHPNGLPAKYAGNARIFRVYPNVIYAYVDIFGGNSGSPVINERTGKVEGLVSHGGSVDYIKDSKGGCYKTNAPKFGSPVALSAVSHFSKYLDSLLTEK